MFYVNHYCNYRCPSLLMKKLLCSTTWSVVLKIVRGMVSFTAMLVTDHYVNNADTNIKKVPTPKTMKLSLTDTANKSFEICQDHPTRNLDIFCREYKTPICSKCSTMKEHKGLRFDDLEDIYADKYTLWQGEFSKIQKYFLPTTQNLKTDIEEEVKQIKK